MYQNLKIISIIPARGGSKRIPRKNVKLLAGKPLIACSIEHSLESKYIDRTIVSTEDKEIRDVALKHGAEVIDRPFELAQDDSKSVDVLKHVLKQLEINENYIPDVIVLLQPTSPIRKKGRIDQAIDIFGENEADCVFSVLKRHNGPQWIFKQKEKQIEFLFENDFSVLRSQDEKPTYEMNGSIYVYSKNVINNSSTYAIGKKIFPLEICKIESFELDEPEDWRIIESIIKK